LLQIEAPRHRVRPAEVNGCYSYFGPTIKSGFNPISDKDIYIYLLQYIAERLRLAR
jgi:hypothetical protein